jgi:AraC-like DNA-binding protein
VRAFFVTGITISALFVIFILAKKIRKRADYLLIVINLFMIGFLMLNLMMSEHLTVMGLFLQALLPYYLMTTFIFFALEFLQVRVRGWLILVIVPVVLSTVYIATDMFVIHHYRDDGLRRLYNDPPFGYHIVFKGNQLLFILALVWIIKKLRRYKHDIKDNFSFTEPIQLRWLMQFSWIYLIIIITSLVSFTATNVDLLPIHTDAAYAVISASTVLAIFYLSFHGIRQYSIAAYYGNPSAVRGSAQEAVPPSEVREKYKTSALSNDQQEATYKNLLTLLEQNKRYLEPNLQLSDVSDALHIGTHELSQTINTLGGMPFYDLVNGYRVKHLRSMLEDPAQKRFTILALGLASGFNSKASINRVFKEVTGLSPSEYQRRNLHP